MGNTSTKGTVAMNDLLKSFNSVRIYQDKRYGQGKILQSKQSGEELFLKEINMTDESIYKKFQSLLAKRINDTHENIVNMLKIVSDDNQQQLCGVFYKFYLLFEFYEQTLDKFVQSLKLQRAPVSEQDLWSIMRDLIEGLAFLQDRQISHQCLNISSITILPNKRVKIIDPSLLNLTPNYIQFFFDAPPNYSRIYLSPNLLIGLEQKKFTPVHNPYKSDVFTLGMILLGLSSTDDCDKCYSYSQPRILKQEFETRINQLDFNYPPATSQIIKDMLILNEQYRPDFLQLRDSIRLEEENNPKRVSQQRAYYNQQIKPNVNRYDVLSENISFRSQKSSEVNQFLMLSPRSQIDSKMNDFFPGNNLIPLALDRPDDLSKVAFISLTPSKQPQADEYHDDDADTVYRLENRIPTRQDQTNEEQVNFNFQQTFQKDTQNREQLIDQRQSNQYQSVKKQLLQDSNGTLGQWAQKLSNLDESQKFFNNKMIEELRGSQMKVNLINSEAQSVKSLQLQSNKQYVNETYQNGSCYIGYKIDGMRHGQGKFIYSDGGYYEGTWFKNKMQGFGTLYYASLKIAYQGSWRDDKFDGEGVIFNEDPKPLNKMLDPRDLDLIGDYWVKYEGGFKDDNKEGLGKLFLTNGEKFEGYFLNDFASGPGQYTNMKGEVTGGQWWQNKLQY